MEERRNSGRRIFDEIGDLRDYIRRVGAVEIDTKRFDLALAELQSIIINFVQRACEGIVIIQGGKFVYVNKATCKISGYSLPEMMNMSVRDLMTPDMRNKAGAREKMLLNGDLIELPEEWSVLRKDRTLRYINTFGYRINYLEKPAVLVFFYDITRQKKMQDELLMQAEIINSINDSIFLHDIDGKITYVNQTACERCGYTREEMLKMNILDITAPELKRRFGIRIKQYSKKKDLRFETVHIARDGSRMPVEVVGKMVKRGGQSFLLGVARQINVSLPERLDTPG